MKIFSSIIFILLVLIACESPDSEDSLDLLAITIEQGIVGRVWFWEGDFQPESRGTIIPVQRDVLAHTITHFDSVDRVGVSAFYNSIGTTLVSEVRSNDSGFFQIPLLPGEYSIFVLEDTLFYANVFNGQGFIYPVSVFNDSVTQIDFNITYKATY